MNDKKYGVLIGFRVDKDVSQWWETKCKKEGVKKGEPFQKAIEAAYLKDHEKKINDPEPIINKDDLHLNEENKLKLKSEAEKLNKSESDLLNDILKARYLKSQTIEINSFEIAENRTFRFKPSFYQNIVESAKKNNMGTTKFVMAVLAAKMSDDQYFFNDQESLILGQSNSQLLAIGRNLNQIAKNMNAEIYEAYDRQFIKELNEKIRAHVKQVYLLLERNKKLWE